MQKNITLIYGDCSSPEIVTQAVRVLDKIAELYGHTFHYTDVDMGGCAIDKWGDPLPQEMLDKCVASDSVLLGAVGGDKWNDVPGPKRPEKGLLRLRAGMGVYSNNRPAKIWPQLSDASPLKKSIVEKGIDFIIDGHSHTVMANKQVTDASGKAVTLTQTGSYFKNIGKMTVGADGTITTELIDTYEGLDAAVAATASNWISAVDDMLGEEIAVGDTKFYINDPATGKRRIRSGETNLGDFVADGIYTYFNEIEELHCDVAIMNLSLIHI